MLQGHALAGACINSPGWMSAKYHMGSCENGWRICGGIVEWESLGEHDGSDYSSTNLTLRGWVWRLMKIYQV